MIASTVSTFASLIIGLIVLFIAILAVLAPVFIYLIYRLVRELLKVSKEVTIGINHIMAYLHNIQANTKPEPNPGIATLPDINLDGK